MCCLQEQRGNLPMGTPVPVDDCLRGHFLHFEHVSPHFLLCLEDNKTRSEDKYPQLDELKKKLIGILIIFKKVFPFI